MRLGLLSLCGLSIGLGAMLGGCEKQQEEAAVPVAADGSSAGSEIPAPASPPSIEIAEEKLYEQMPSLQRVAQALEGAPVNVSITRGEQLEKARAWVEENEPDLPARERELMAQTLVIMSELMDSEQEINLKRMVGMGESQLLQLWAMDADGDGRLSAEEAGGQLERWESFFRTVGEYNKEQFDTDGDGNISDAEMAQMSVAMNQSMEPLYTTMVERATLVEWDSDRDGVVSDAEREAGESGLELADWDQDGVISDMERLAAYGPILQEFSQGLVLVEQPDMTEMQQEMQAEMMARMGEMQTPPPAETDFDLDGDGVMNDVETAAFQQEMEAFSARQAVLQAEMQSAGEDFTTRMVQLQFDSAVQTLDKNADGLLMNEEWEAGYTDLRTVRDQRMFQYLYDGDRSGAVDEPDVARFMDAYDSGSAYADADMDGEVNENDLRRFMDLVTGQ